MISDNKEREKPHTMEEDIFTRLFEQAEIAHFTKRERQEYEESLKAYRDWYSVTKTSFDKGMAEGIQKGTEEGILLVAKRMKEDGWELKDIAKYTSLPLSKIKLL